MFGFVERIEPACLTIRVKILPLSVWPPLRKSQSAAWTSRAGVPSRWNTVQSQYTEKTKVRSDFTWKGEVVGWTELVIYQGQ